MSAVVDEILRVHPERGVWREVDGEVVLLVVETGAYLGLNSSASTLWGALAAGTTRAELVDLLQLRYNLDKARASHDVRTFLDTCERHGLVAR